MSMSNRERLFSEINTKYPGAQECLGEVFAQNRTFKVPTMFSFPAENKVYQGKFDQGFDKLLSLVSVFPQGAIGSLEVLGGVANGVAGMLQETIKNAIPGCEFFPRNPKKEIPRLVEMLAESCLNDRPVSIVVPVCPDYGQVGYQLRNGIGPAAQKALRALPEISALLNKHGFPTHIRIDVADVEAQDSAILQATGESESSFLSKVRETRDKIASAALLAGISGTVDVQMMSQAFAREGRNYADSQATIARQLETAPTSTAAQVAEQLRRERSKLGDFSGLDEATQRSLVNHELAGYTAYGQLIGGSAIIASPDSMSAIPAYHFAASSPDTFSPVVYIKK